jgi:hypothetical protein
MEQPLGLANDLIERIGGNIAAMERELTGSFRGSRKIEVALAPDRQVVDPDHAVSVGEQALDQMTGDETRRPGHNRGRLCHFARRQAIALRFGPIDGPAAPTVADRNPRAGWTYPKLRISV